MTKLLDIVQSGFSLESHPYAVLGNELGLTEREVYDELLVLQKEGTIRRIGASFASGKLGYVSSLCAFAVEPSEVDRVAALMEPIPNITHNYGRNDRYNLWFTVIARSQDALTSIVDRLAKRAEVTDVLNLPATALYKIKVDFSEQKGKDAHAVPEKEETPEKESDSSQAKTPKAQQALKFNPDDPFDIELVRFFQEDLLDDGLEPFDQAASTLSAHLGKPVSEAEVLQRLQQLKSNGTIRRFGAMVRHHRLGYAFNAMTVWSVPAEYQDAIGQAFAQCPAVSHCYARPERPTWPYNLYAMIHGKTEDAVYQVVSQLQTTARECCSLQLEAKLLLSTREYKKTSMLYFSEED